MAKTLDTRPARPLTSRECTKVICAVVFGLRETGVPEVHLRQAMENVLTIHRRQPVPTTEVMAGWQPAWHGAIAGCVGGLATWCDKEVVATACEWILEQWNRMMPKVSA